MRRRRRLRTIWQNNRSGGRSRMLKQIEGSMAIAEAVALCRPEVICAYPITPQTPIIETYSKFKDNDRKI